MMNMVALRPFLVSVQSGVMHSIYLHGFVYNTILQLHKLKHNFPYFWICCVIFWTLEFQSIIKSLILTVAMKTSMIWKECKSKCRQLDTVTARSGNCSVCLWSASAQTLKWNILNVNNVDYLLLTKFTQTDLLWKHCQMQQWTEKWLLKIDRTQNKKLKRSLIFSQFLSLSRSWRLRLCPPYNHSNTVLRYPSKF